MNLVLARSSLPPTPIIASMLFAARRVDDFALAVRILDVVEHKLGGGLWKTKKGRKKEEWERVMGELKEVLDELGEFDRRDGGARDESDVRGEGEARNQSS